MGATVITELKFPCGYEFKQVIKLRGLHELTKAKDVEWLRVCPLHGKDCAPFE